MDVDFLCDYHTYTEEVKKQHFYSVRLSLQVYKVCYIIVSSDEEVRFIQDSRIENRDE